MRSTTASLLISVALIALVWLVGRAVGFEISLAGSLALTVGLTLIVNLVLAAFRGGRRRLNRW